MNDQGDTSQSLGPGHPLQSSAEDGERISATVPIAPAHMPLTYTYLVCYGGGIGEDVWDKSATIHAENIVSAALKATDMCREFNGQVFEIIQVV